MMNIEAEFPFATLELGQSKMKMIELPYVGDRIVMQILIPHENNKQGESNIDSTTHFQQLKWRVLMLDHCSIKIKKMSR